MQHYRVLAMICLLEVCAFGDAVAASTDNQGEDAARKSPSSGFSFRLSDSSNKRTAFVRMEKSAQVMIDITNETGHSPTKAAVKVKCDGNEVIHVNWLDMQNKETRTISIPIDTAVRADRYIYSIAVAADDDSIEGKAEYEIPVFIVNRSLPYQMPVVLWGIADLKLAQSLGFTHCFQFLPDNLKVWEAKSPTAANAATPRSPAASKLDDVYLTLNEALTKDFGIVACIEPHRYNPSLSPYFRIDRQGNGYTGNDAENVCGFFEEIKNFYSNIGVSIAQTYGAYPALTAAIINTEVRDHANLCFHPHDVAAYQTYSGKEVPKIIKGKYGVNYMALTDFPAKHIIPDDDDILQYLKWYWQEGDGWNNLTSLVHQGLHSTGRTDLWTFTDPAIRVPSLSGSGGQVDGISQWIYCYPNPIKIGKAVDELLAMASLASKPQDVYITTQAIWYRSLTAPADDGVAPQAAWEHEKADASLITIPPDALREAFWSKIARGVRGIMYHGLGSITEMGELSWGYSYTNSETKAVIKELAENIVKPLGPTFLQIPETKSDIAFLQSFTSQMYAGAGEYGWGEGWENDAYEILLYAQLQPRVIYEEHIAKDELKDIKVLALIQCPVLTATTVQKIEYFQKKGGLIIADENVCLAISPDIVMKSCRRPGQDAFAGKQQLQEKAQQLRRELDPYYSRYTDCDNADVLVRVRRRHNTDYVFVMNDKRTYGDYIGHHKLVMEKGLPSQASVTVNRKNGYLYDLKLHQEIQPAEMKEALGFPVSLGPGDGSVVMICPQKIATVKLDVRGTPTLGNTVMLYVTLLDDRGERMEAVVPCCLEITDPQDRPVEYSGFYGLNDGELTLKLDIAQNDLAGEWKISAQELASGIKGTHKFSVMSVSSDPK